MVNSSGSFRSFLWINFFWSRLRILLLGTSFAFTSAFAAGPDYLHAALERFIPEVPKNWAYSLTTERDGGQHTTEHFDPSKPPTEQWSLLMTEGHAPTSQDLEKYFKYKASQSPGAMKATFQKGDIEPGTLKLLHEDADRAEFTCQFREQSANADKMLGHLSLVLTINKHPPCYVEKFRLILQAPYSPVLTVKMNELVVTMDFSPPVENTPSLPSRSSSHFAGRIFFVSVEENLSYRYFDFTPVR